MHNKNQKSICSIFFSLIILLSSIFLLRLNNTHKIESAPPIEYTLIRIKTEKGEQLHYVDKYGEDYAILGTYSMIDRVLDANGNAVQQMYYFSEKPIPHAYGQYGDRYLYDAEGRLIKRTFLDQDGNPMMGNCEYATIVQTYNDNGTLKTERYFDIDGNPTKSGSGCYGKRYICGITFLLNKHGHLTVSVNTLFDKTPELVVFIALIIVLLLCCFGKKMKIAIWGTFFIFILLQTLIREPTQSTSTITLFWSYRQFFHDRNLRNQILYNIWLFVPLGAGICTLFHKPRYLFIPIMLSVLVELFQLTFQLGLAEFDDILSNTLGACIGFVFACDILKIKEFFKQKFANASYEKIKESVISNQE